MKLHFKLFHHFLAICLDFVLVLICDYIDPMDVTINFWFFFTFCKEFFTDSEGKICLSQLKRLFKK